MKKKTLLTIVLWIVYYLTLSVLLSGYEGLRKSLQISSIIVLMQAAIVHINTLVLIPYLFQKKKITFYILSVLFVILFLAVIRFQIPSYLVDGSNEALTRVRRVSFLFNTIIAYALSTAYYFIAEWFRNVQLKAELKYRQVEDELKYLKNQINPHFMFNTLNNIYTLCYLKDEKAPLAVMKLSDMMRYILTESNNQLIELEREIKFINDYLELQKLKKEEPMQICFNVKGVKSKHLIAPLLLINFFENCFKHGDIENNSDGWIEAELSVDEKNEMSFQISNSKKVNINTDDSRNHLGLDNVSKRLAIQYKDRHLLTINEDDNKFIVQLTLKIDV